MDHCNAAEADKRTPVDHSRHRNLFPTLDSLYKLFYLSLKDISAKWTKAVPNWPDALNRFSIEFADRMPDNN